MMYSDLLKKQAVIAGVLSILVVLGRFSLVQAQNPANQIITVPTDSLLFIDDDFKPTLEINPYAEEEKKKKAKKKKRKKKVFYGVRTKVHFTREVSRNSVVFEKFHVLKEHKDPNKFAYDIYYYNTAKKKIEKTPFYKPEFGPLLHGMYERTAEGQTVEKGLFFYGTKDGRWEKYGRDMLLLDKKYYYHGNPKYSQVIYYDNEQKKVKEVIPIQYDKKDGIYMLYYESGNLAEVGMYVDDIKVGRWYEYFDRPRPNTKREILYVNPNTPYDEVPPVIVREWDEKGKKLVDNSKSLSTN
jgi:hypothetical protein